VVVVGQLGVDKVLPQVRVILLLLHQVKEMAVAPGLPRDLEVVAEVALGCAAAKVARVTAPAQLEMAVPDQLL
jgi:hypothetical protein